MDSPNYRIQEHFDFYTMTPYYKVQRLNLNPVGGWVDAIVKDFDHLEDAEEALKILRKYDKGIFHFVEDEHEFVG
jgi:hypothetical protein